MEERRECHDLERTPNGAIILKCAVCSFWAAASTLEILIATFRVHEEFCMAKKPPQSEKWRAQGK